jgi:tetratricopeptide (TPR) repeat protein
VKTFRALVDNDKFRDFAQRDVALFYYGYLLADAKYMKEARAVWDQLLKDYPNSTFVPATYLQFAEYYAASQKLVDAEALYKKVLTFPKADGYWYAYYRLGWVHMKNQRYQEALEAMFLVTKGAQQTALVSAARNDFVAAYAEIGKPSAALEAFRRVDKASAMAMYRSLGERYIAQGAFDKGAIVYGDLLTTAPKDPDACTWLLTSARLWAQSPAVKDGVAIQLPSEQQAASEIEALASFAKTGRCKADIATWINVTARATHNAAIQHQRPARDAIRFYRLALDLDPSFETRWLSAEAVWLEAENIAAAQSDKPTSAPVVQAWSDAGRAFLDIARDTRTPADRSREAALGAVFAYANAMFVDPDLAKLVEPGAKKLTPLSTVEASYIGAVDLYQTIVRDAKDLELARMRFVIATLHRRHGDHAKAVPVLVDFLAAQRDSPLADVATAMMLDSQQAIDLGRSRSPRR